MENFEPVLAACNIINKRFESLINDINSNNLNLEELINLFFLFDIWNETCKELKIKYNLPDIPLLGNGFSSEIPDDIKDKLPVSINSLNWNFAKIFELKANYHLDLLENKITDIKKNKLVERIQNTRLSEHDDIYELLCSLLSKKQLSTIVKNSILKDKKIDECLTFLLLNFPEITNELAKINTN